MRTFAALGDDTRVQIVDLLADGERSVGELVAHFRMSQPAVSQHLRVLRDAGIVDVRPDAQRRLYRLRPEPFREIDAWLARYKSFWSDRLDSLERHLAANPRGRSKK